MTAKITPVLLAGGAGSRLWPVSRDQLPKQFQPLVGDLSTYQQTLQRVSDPNLYNKPIVITNEDFRFFAQRQASDVGVPASVVLEPARRDSAAAIAAAAVIAERHWPGGSVLALAADHIVLDDDLFSAAVVRGCNAARDGKIVVFGLTPSEPRTSYGYISPGAGIGGETDLYEVDTFVEKPNVETAISYLHKGYLWNSGNFLFRSDVMISEMEAFTPEVVKAVQKSVDQAEMDLGFLRLDREAFEASPKNSIDYAVIENSKKIAVVRGHFRWSDIGSWDAIWEVASKDDDANAVEGEGVVLRSEGCLVHSIGIMTTVVGAKDLVVVATKDAVLVVPKNRSQDVKGLVDTLKGSRHGEVTENHKRSYRPWGFVEEMLMGERFGVKRLVIDPGSRTSLQRHMNRAEHWVVVGGTATVTIGEESSVLTENESLYVPLGRLHRIANQGRIPLELIEVRTGAYIHDDDVIRVEDDYRRALDA
ncbi:MULTISPECIES: mannose-1-phosphate guanylyltransferase/mannose-6-phosphate isomerase [unclassified Ensifer]|uniref:mannose-1-phosphate guanylyltransferase/mannose-6-phosphate isomerase n=1 Tax=unclassified Ensifer TaxID=2633371 RepID=UPI000715BC76|nr:MULTISPECIES: mannose-1-phosphate guanylyltransferase/mannose-6-phosphate isomerase [unclassified Ensifer]KQX44800.1 mannose-1-phosphate guanylyltransferase [Ensifer sp. Root1298]KQX76642.1 mannose-1-phosphate guanylyltransferase [Ensifer sp. Root1312]KRC17154.1 mannose-1-phosphate guanylyltransferase [Ensifer sp. Root74]KRD62184.1 mannose-1-phosphate guanylyltransferase [Ensifer sp. Root954]